MLDNNAREVILLKSADLAKSHFSKADIEQILKVYKICKDAPENSSLQKLYSGKMAWIAAEAKRQIKDLADGKLSVDADAVVLMNSYLSEFGRFYKREANVLKYVYTQEARQAKVVLAKIAYRQRLKEEAAKISQQQKKAPVVVSKTNVSVNKTKEVTSQPVAGEKKTYFYTPTKSKEPIASISRNHSAQAKNRTKLKPALPKQKVSLLKKFKKGLSNATHSFNNSMKSTANRIKVASIACLMAYPLFSVVSGNSKTIETDVVNDIKVASKSLAYTVPTTVNNAHEENLSENDDNLVTGLPENFLWTEYEAIKDSAMVTNSIDSVRTLTAEVKSVTNRHVDRDTLSFETIDYEPRLFCPYSNEYAEAIAINDSTYKEFTLQLTNQFLYNISEMAAGRNLYREKEKLIGKYYDYNRIIPNKSCESMTFATFLDVLERGENEKNYVHTACRDLLLNVVNPHGCHSNIDTFDGISCRNLRSALSERLKKDEYGIYMVWIPRGGGKYHRQTVIGVGHGEAYLLAFNNNRAIKMDVDNLNKISVSRGYFADLGGKIMELANSRAIEDYKKEKIQKKVDVSHDYYAWHLNKNVNNIRI